MRVLFVAAEIYPLIKTGGLADVAGALPQALLARGIDVRCLLPGYAAVLAGLREIHEVLDLPDLFGGEGRLLEGRLGGDGLRILAVAAPHLFERDGHPYLGPDRLDWPDNDVRFAALSWVAAELGRGRLEGWQPDVVHAHDWHAGLAPAYLALGGGPRPATVMTVHNLAFQGLFPVERLAALRLPPQGLAVEGFEYHGRIGFLKAGLYYADHITTVSPTYAREIRTPAHGCGLEGLLSTRAGDLTGILNGIDLEIWNPRTDPHLATPYGTQDLDSKAVNKASLQARLGLAPRPATPLIGVISRLSQQKGLDLLQAALPDLLSREVQIALLVAGDADLEEAFQAAADAHPGNIGLVIGYDEPLAHLIQGGADMVLVPSRYEPCGLTQLYGLRYGSVPVVARVGGLADSIVDANAAALEDGVATGFAFAPVTQAGLLETLDRALQLYAEPARWRAVQQRGMTRETGWDRAAAQYAGLYQGLVQRCRPAPRRRPRTASAAK